MSQYDRIFGPNMRALSMRVARRTVGHHDAEDMVQDAYARFVNKISCAKLENPASYFLTILDNLRRDHLRARTRRARILGSRVSAERIEDVVAEESLTRELFASEDDRILQLARGILRLSSGQQEILYRRLGKGLTYAQIGDYLGKSTSQVERLYKMRFKSLGRTCIRSVSIVYYNGST